MPKAKLTITGDTPDARVFEIDRSIVIGRSVKADVQIEGDLVSRQHAKIVYRDGQWLLEDLGSRNGVLLNGARAATSPLQSGDVIMIGYGRIEFEEAGAGPSSELQVSIVESHADLTSATVADDEPDDNSGATVALSYQNLVRINERLTVVSRISRDLATVLEREELLDRVLATFMDLFPQIDRSAIVLRDRHDAFHVVATRQRGGGEMTGTVMRISTSLIQFVRKERKAVLSADTAQDSRFSGRESIVGGTGRSIMCAPLLVKDDFLGVVYLDTQSLQQPFKHNDLNLLQGVAGPVGIFLKNAELVSKIEQETTLRTSLSRYLSPDVVREIGDGSMSADLGGNQAEGTIMFSDIVGFTAMSERMTPADVVERLNRYFTSMLEAIFGWEGTVDKFGGDAVLAVWGAPLSNEDHARMATSAALEMQVRLFELNLALAEAGETTIGMAVGLNSGKFVAGNIGGQDRIEWTVIGDTVNLAQRVESQGFPACVLVSQSTYEGLDGKSAACAFEPIQVKNRQEPVTIYGIRTLRNNRGIVASVPVQISWNGGSCAGVIGKVHTKESTRLSLKIAEGLDPGVAVKLTADLPEFDKSFVLEGSVRSSAPLLLSKNGRAIDVDVQTADEGFSRLFASASAVPAARTLAEIGR